LRTSSASNAAAGIGLARRNPWDWMQLGFEAPARALNGVVTQTPHGQLGVRFHVLTDLNSC
jgi:hypothetical protein